MSDSTSFDHLNAALAGRYAIQRELGEGGMATVYLARDERHDRSVAIKVLRPELAAVIGAERFLAEIQTTANLQHPHILPLHDSGEVDGTVFYVMPLVEGESIRERLGREKQLPISDAVRIATEVAGALDYAHRKGVIHRDIKPENIMLHDERAVVADFGIALAASRTEGVERLTETGMSIGTPHYMSPEQATGERDLDARADIYALGCVLYEMLVGEPPFTGPTAQSIVAKLLTGEPSPVTDVRKMVPPHVAAAVRTALQKLPADRFGSAAELAEALNDPTRGPLAAAAGASGADAAPSPVARVLPWAVAAAAVAFALFGRAGPGAEAPEARTPVRFALHSPERTGVRAIGALAISRDGREVVFEGSSEGRTLLYRRSLTQPGINPLPGTEGAPFAALSPDGSRVAYWSPDSLVRSIDLGGGGRVVEAHARNYPIGMSWHESAGLLFGMLSYDGDYAGVLAVAPGDTTVRVVTDPRAEGGEFRGMHHEPYVLDDGEHALVIDFPGGPPGRGLGLVSLADGSIRRIELPGLPLLGGRAIVGIAEGVLLYLSQGRRLAAVAWDDDALDVSGDPVLVPGAPDQLGAAVVSADGTLAMIERSNAYEAVIVDDRGNVLTSLSDESVNDAFPRFSPDGSRVAVGAPFRETPELWLYDLESGLLSQLGIGFGTRVVEWAENGARVVAGPGRFGGDPIRGMLLSRAADARDNPGPFFELPEQIIEAVSLSGDGQQVAVAINVGPGRGVDRYDIAVVGLADGASSAFADGPANEVAPRFSPDGRWLAYASDESGRYEVYVRPYPGPGARTQISDGGGGQPVWAADGGRIFYRTDRAMMAADVTVDGGALRVTDRERLFEGDFFEGPGAITATFDVHPDGRRFVLARALSPGGEVIVWRDWLHEVRDALGLGGR